MLNEEEDSGLKYQATMYTDMGLYGLEEKEEMQSEEWKDKTIDDVFLYNCKDADATLRLYGYQLQKIGGQVSSSH